VTDKANKWSQKLMTKEKDYQKNGWSAKINQRPQATSKYDLIRIDAQMRNVNPDGILDYFINPPKEKASMIKESRILE